MSMTEFTLQDFYLFVRLAESLSVAAVARERNEHPSQVSRALSRMEAECGLRLFHRSTHGLSLTDDGRIFLEHAKTISHNATALADDLASRSDRVSGLVRISAPCILAEYVLIPHLRELVDRHADLNVSLHISDKQVDMSTEGTILPSEPASLRETRMWHVNLDRIDGPCMPRPPTWPSAAFPDRRRNLRITI